MRRESETEEIEWQFDALDLRPVERWLATVPTLSVEPYEQTTITASAQPPQRLVDVYLDTDDWRMARAGFVVRTRRRGRRDDITLKTAQWAQGGALRPSLSVSEELSPAGVGALTPDGAVGRRTLAIAGRKALRPVLEVRTRRRSYVLHIDGGDAAEIALDDTVIVVGNGQRPMQLRRVEVRVFDEWTDALGPLVLQLRAACGLQTATLSKFEAGLLAGGIAIPEPPDLGPTAIDPGSTLGDVAFAVLRRQLAVLRAKEPGTRLGEDPEELHDMRVATRRLRAALDLFAEVLPIRARHFRRELGWLADVLGAVRDLDVQLEAQAAMVEPGQEMLWTDLTNLLARERDAARVTMLEALESVRWDRLLAGMTAMVQQGPFRRSTATRSAALLAVPDLICSRHTAVVKAAKRAKRSGQAADFHRLRIRCKRLRYSLEFGAELYEGRTNRYTRQLAKLQNQLGWLQDAEVAATRLADLATGETALPASTIFVMGGVAELHRQEMTRLLERLPAELSRVRGRDWDELITTMERGRGRALALVPPARRTLRVVPVHSSPELVEAAAPDGAPAPALLRPEVPFAATGGESSA